MHVKIFVSLQNLRDKGYLRFPYQPYAATNGYLRFPYEPYASIIIFHFTPQCSLPLPLLAIGLQLPWQWRL